MNERPTCAGRATACAAPDRTPRTSDVVDETVEVEEPGGRLRNAQTAPTESASVISAPPCIRPPAVHRSGAHGSDPVTSVGVAASRETPAATAKGMRASSSAGGGTSSPRGSAHRSLPYDRLGVDRARALLQRAEQADQLLPFVLAQRRAHRGLQRGHLRQERVDQLMPLAGEVDEHPA